MGRLGAAVAIVLGAFSLVPAGRQAPAAPATPLASRIAETPASVLKMFADAGEPAPRPHTLTPDERKTLAAAFESLPPLHRRVIEERLQSISFLDGMPNTALTSPIDPGSPVARYHWTIRAGVLHETVSQFLTAKERTIFTAGGSTAGVSIEAGTRDAMLYVLLHEGTHVVDAALGLTPPMPREGAPAPPRSTPFTEGVWHERLIAATPYRDTRLEQVPFRAGGNPLPMAEAPAVYEALKRTPFVSVYATTNWYDDLAETLSIYHLTERLRQPFRIVIHDAGREVFAYEPAKAPLVRRRFDHMARFYD